MWPASSWPTKRKFDRPRAMRLRLASAMLLSGGDRGEAQEAAERPMVVEQVSDRPAHSGARLEGASVPAAPAQQPSEERSRALAPKLEVLGRADDAGVLRVAFHDVDLADEVERLLRFRMLTLLVESSVGRGRHIRLECALRAS